MVDNKKGEAGKDTGAATRVAIRQAMSRGHTFESIGTAVDRDASTIAAILEGEIKNPPAELAGRISALKTRVVSGKE